MSTAPAPVRPPIPDPEEIAAKAASFRPGSGAIRSEDEFEAWLHLSSPRVRFIKSLPFRSTLLDLGAGDGSMVGFRKWLLPERKDLEFYAVSMEKGAHFDLYAGHELLDFNQAKPSFGGRTFDAMFASHFAEHVDGGPAAVLGWAHGRLRPGGRVYIEMPSEFSKTAPSRTVFTPHNIPASTLNFFDDSSHQETVTLDELRAAAEAAGFFVEESGFWRNEALEDELISMGTRRQDSYKATVGLWMKFYFCQYISVVRL